MGGGGGGAGSDNVNHLQHSTSDRSNPMLGVFDGSASTVVIATQKPPSFVGQ